MIMMFSAPVNKMKSLGYSQILQDFLFKYQFLLQTFYLIVLACLNLYLLKLLFAEVLGSNLDSIPCYGHVHKCLPSARLSAGILPYINHITDSVQELPSLSCSGLPMHPIIVHDHTYSAAS
jgi:hypothetical protein